MSEPDLWHGPRFLEDGGVEFRVWAPSEDGLMLRWGVENLPLEQDERGFWAARVGKAVAGDRYAFMFWDRWVRPDPASRRQAHGLHEHSTVFDVRSHSWRHDFPRRPLQEFTFYELHVGTFTEAGTLDAAAARLPELRELGITCVQLMPVNPFPGSRNWGDDAVFPYAVAEGYGGPEALLRFVDCAHGLHFEVCLGLPLTAGVEANYAPLFAPHQTHGRASDSVAVAVAHAFVVGAALQWVRDFRIDALRLDPGNTSECTALVEEITERVRAEGQESGRAIRIVSELPPTAPAGRTRDVSWMRDLQETLYAVVTQAKGPEALARALEDGFQDSGKLANRPERAVLFAQSHDSVSRRMGVRLASLLPPSALEAVAAFVILAGPLPMHFMGEEYGETRPFHLFTHHMDRGAANDAIERRRQEFVASGGVGSFPNPQDPLTYEESRLTHRRDGHHGKLWATHQQLHRLRAQHREVLTQTWPRVGVEGTVFTLTRPGLVFRVNLGPNRCAGLDPWEWKTSTSMS